MTTETKPPNPRHVALADEFLKKLEALAPDVAEEVVGLRIVARHGIARKVKWLYEVETCFS